MGQHPRRWGGSGATRFKRIGQETCEGQEALEAELLGQGATCVLVSHDRSFVRAVGNRFWLIEGKRLVEVDDPEPFFNGALG